MDPNPVPVSEEPMETAQPPPSSPVVDNPMAGQSAVITIGDGTSGSIPAFTVRIGDNIVATAPLVIPSPQHFSVSHQNSPRSQTAFTMFKTQQQQSAINQSFQKDSPLKRSAPPVVPFTAYSTINTSSITQADDLEPGMPTLANAMELLDEYPPPLPDSVMNHYLHAAGFESSDIRMSRLISTVALKYMYGVIKDSLSISKARNAAAAAASGKPRPKDAKNILVWEDLSESLKERGIKVNKYPKLDHN